MISFRTADISTEGDAMAALLRETFNQSIFTVGYLTWKHVENPAGKSFVLIAEEDSKIIGLRIFMYWDFNINGRNYKALRPVDTAVHKDYQGKGLFKQLTLKGLDMTKGNFDFIFNTPNNNSLPGYLKMGWTKINSDATFYVNPVIPFPAFMKSRNGRKHDAAPAITEFIKWRYQPARYKWAIFNDGSLVVYRIERRKFFNLLIVVDTGAGNNLRAKIRSLCSKEKALAYFFLYSQKTQSLKSIFSIKKGSPVIVSKDADGILDKWNFQSGDVEGIL